MDNIWITYHYTDARAVFSNHEDNVFIEYSVFEEEAAGDDHHAEDAIQAQRL